MTTYVNTSPVRIEIEMKNMIDQIARDERRTKTAVMRQLFEDGLKFRGLTPPAQNAQQARAVSHDAPR